MKTRMFAPGPVEIDHSHYQLTLDQSLNHRTPEFSTILKEASQLLGRVMGTKQPVILLTSSGTGGMEAAVCSLFAPGERVLVLNTGVFGARFGEIAHVHGLETTEYKPAPGVAVNPAEVKKLLESDPSIRGILMQHVDTSTAIRNDIASIGSLCHTRDVLLVVDTISGLIANQYAHDDWGVDVTISASQKGFEIPPGLAFVAMSQRARERLNNRRDIGSYYLNLQTARAFFDKPQSETPFTPALGLIRPLISRLHAILDRGLPSETQAHARMAQVVRAAVAALGLELFTAEGSSCDTVTAVKIPESIDGGRLVTDLRERHGMIVAGGQEELAGKLLRIGHIGRIDFYDTLGLLGALELALTDCGYHVVPGTALAAAIRCWREIVPTGELR